MSRAGALVALVVAIAVLPRIPLGIAIPGRTFDLRVEDLLLVVFFCVLVVQLASGRALARTPLAAPVLTYLAVASFTTLVAMAALGLDVARSLLYLAKEVEYFVLLLVVVNWARTDDDLRVVLRALVVVAVANVAWVATQLAMGRNTSLGALVPGVGEFTVGAARLQSYGPQLIGEPSPLSAGGFFMLAFLVVFAWLLLAPDEPWRKRRLAALSVALLACVVLTLSRVSFAGALVGAALLLALHLRRRQASRSALAVVALGAVAVLVAGVGVLQRLDAASLSVSLGERVNDIWAPLWQAFLERPLLGHGKGSIGALPGLGEGEAHNSYLRFLVEGGVLELVAFLWILGTVALVSSRLTRSATTTRGRVLAGATLAATAAMMVGALFQDAFVPVLLNETYWLLVALTCVAWRLETAAPSAANAEGAARAAAG